MKKITFLVLLFLGLHYTFAQLPVSQTAENKNVVLEEFTGIHCQYCPDGHHRAQLIQDSYPDDVVLINIHTGYYANPGAGEPDFRTQLGNNIASEFGVSYFPSGMVNRHIFSGSSPVMGRGDWSSAANTILLQSAYCNIALEADVDIQTRVMTVDVEVYYTADAPVSSNFINVALLQDNIEGPQVNGSSNPDQVLPNGKYNHMHMLRHLITGQWGDEVTTVTQGTLIQRQYTYTLPADINGVDLDLGNIQIVGFVAEGHQEIITGNKGVISFSGFQYNLNAEIINVSSDDFICSSSELNPRVTIKNTGSQAITDLTLEYNVNNEPAQTYTWTGTINSLGTQTIDLPDLNFTLEPNNTLSVNITSVNGNNTDENITDNSQTINFNETTNEGQGTDYVVTLVQDQYGSETTWVITDEADNVISYGGPYSNLSGSGTQTHIHNVTLDTSGCYKFYVLDSYGDGMCCSFGNGSYQMAQADGTIVLQGDGNFGSQVKQYFSIDATNSIEDAAFQNLKIYPNPTTGTIFVNNAKNMQLKIFNVNGSLVYQHKGLIQNETLQLNLSTGVYLAKFIKKDKVAVRKIVITK